MEATRLDSLTTLLVLYVAYVSVVQTYNVVNTFVCILADACLVLHYSRRVLVFFIITMIVRVAHAAFSAKPIFAVLEQCQDYSHSEDQLTPTGQAKVGLVTRSWS